MITNKQIDNVLVPKIIKARADGHKLYFRTSQGIRHNINYCSVKSGITIYLTSEHTFKLDAKYLAEECNVQSLDDAIELIKVDLTLKDL